VTDEDADGRFFVRKEGRRWATPLFLVLLTVEFTDLIFALDSIPAIFAVTPDPFIVYTSNVFAILGLRSLYFALAGVMDLFCHLKFGLAAILAFVGVKMALADLYPIPIGVSLAVVGAILLVSIAASIIWPGKPAGGASGTPAPPKPPA
jgi:tellurite resistance protein TerC